MKKFLSVFLTICLLCVISTMLVSCIHICEFSGNHVWDEGVITKKATQDADGVKTFTCTECKQTKTEAVEFTGYTLDEWNAIINSYMFENFQYTEVSKTSGNGITISSETNYKFTKNYAYVKVTIGNQSSSRPISNITDINTARRELINSIIEITHYGSFEYDPETKTYKAKSPIEISSLNTSTSKITLKFSEDKLTEIFYGVAFKQNGVTIVSESTITLSDYGTVVLP
ncbi:MAG: hypothetical protein IJW76_04895 [Clostridia bacterium]|nr:hypothetical protein [Clostridia bacterium]